MEEQKERPLDMLQKLPVDLSTFRILREENYLYVDKTRYAYNLITGGRRYFLSRPRRFGKSLFVSTLKEILLGNKDLFEGLWIGTSDYHWKEHGVIVLDFSQLDARTPDEFRISLLESLVATGAQHDLIIDQGSQLINIVLRDLVLGLYEKYGHVAILIDEYDSPLLRSFHDHENASAILARMHDFFSAIKSHDAFINFVFITGVSAFAKAGLFSGMNNLQIMTLDKDYAALFGYTDEEIDFYFKNYLEEWSKKEDRAYSALREDIKKWYNGYHFGKNVTAVYNPFSLTKAIKAEELENFWFQSGTPTFLVKVLKKEYRSFDPEKLYVSAEELGSFEIEDIPVKVLLFQTGYLTVANYDKERGYIRLDYPNYEVKISLQRYLLEVFTHVSLQKATDVPHELMNALQDNNMDDVVELLKVLFAHIPYQLHMKEEKFYHALFQMICSIAGINAQSEYSTSHGRIDLVLEVTQYIYIIEIKFNESAEVALQQIEDRKYYERFIKKGKTIVLVGLSFKREPSDFSITYATKKI